MPALAALDSRAKAPLASPPSWSCRPRFRAAAGENPLKSLSSSPCYPPSCCTAWVLRLTHAFGGQRDEPAHHVAEHRLLADPDIRLDRHARDQMEVRRYTVQVDPIQGDPGPIEPRAAGSLRDGHVAGRVALLILRGEAVGADDPHHAVRHAVPRVDEGLELDVDG